jgi:beta-glucanase (GH16 family)
MLLVPLLAAPASAQWTQVWSDEFNGTSLDTSNWSYETGGGGWGNHELQNYTSRPENVRVSGGTLIIEARAESYGGNAYTSARLRSMHKRFWKYGKIEARIQVPSAKGIWPAFWMLGENFDSVGWPRCGEIDIMEHPSGGNLNYASMHWDLNGHQYYTGQISCGAVCGAAYHTYGLEWTPTELRWYFDGVNFHTGNITINDTEEFHNPFFILLNVAVGGDWPGPPDGTTTFPQRMFVDWVRVYQQGVTGPTPTPAPTPTPGGPTATPPPSGDFSQSVVSTGSSSAQIQFVPNGYTAGYVIAHYLINNVNQQNLNMAWNAGAGRWELPVSGLSSGAQLSYFFTYQKNGTQFDSQWFIYVHGGGTSPTATPTPPTGGCNQEITPSGGAVTASANDGNVPSNATDNSWATRWSANGDGQWLKLDLGSVQTAAYVKLAFYNGNVRQSRFDLQTSTDNSTWTNVLTGAMSSGTSTGEQTFDFTDRSARWVRYLGHGNTVNAWNSLYEISVFGCGGAPTSTPPPGATPTPVPTATPMPPGATPTPNGGCYSEVTPAGSAVTASTNDGNIPQNTVDNSLSTRWSASGDGQWIRYDLGSTQTVGHVRIAFYSGNTRQSRFDLQTSTDGASWTNALTNAMSSGTTTQEQTFDFTDRAARYVRYFGHGNTVNTWNSLYEVSIFAACGGASTPTPTPPSRVTPTSPPPSPGGTHKRLKIISGCSQPMWIQYLPGNNGGTLTAPNRFQLNGAGSFIEYDIPDKGLAGLRVWPGYGCDGAGNNCTIGASGGPVSQGFSCPAGIGCSPPVDSKWEGTFGCIQGIDEGSCQQNPSGSGALGRGDWWNSSFVDGYTVPMKVNVVGYCPTGPQPAPVFGPGGPPGGVIDCSNIRYADCPRAENLSTDGQFSSSPGSPGGTTLSSQDLLLRHPNPDGSYSSTPVGCFSPSGKLTMGQWQAIPKPPFTGTYYAPTDPQAQMYACPSPPITPDQCSAGPASRTQYTNMIHSKCQTYAYPYDDAFGLASCPAATNLKYEVTFYCPQ